MAITDSSKPLAFAVAAWLDSQGDAKLKEAAAAVSSVFSVDPRSPVDRETYAKNSPGLQAIFDVFLKTQERMGGAASQPKSTAKEEGVSEADKARAEELKNEGNKYMSAKDYGAALNSYTQAIELYPSSPVFYSNRAAAYSQIGQHDEAINDAKKAAEIDPNFGKAYSRLGHALFASGRFAEAAEAYEKGVEVDPSNKLMKTGLDTSKAKLAESGSKDAVASTPTPNLNTGAGGFPGAGAGGMPDLSSLMNNPMVSQMAQQMYVPTWKLTCQDAERRPGAAHEQPDAASDGGELRLEWSDAGYVLLDEQPSAATVRIYTLTEQDGPAVHGRHGWRSPASVATPFIVMCRSWCQLWRCY